MLNTNIKWDRSLLNYGRSRPMYSPEIHRFLNEILGKENVHECGIYSEFKANFQGWIQSSTLNSLVGLDNFKVSNIIRGVTHALDDFHIRFGDKLVILPDEYKYHHRIKTNQRVANYQDWRSGDVAIISFPFSHTGMKPENWEKIILHCEKEGVPIHIDAAWYGICREIELDLSSNAIKSISFSLSKALGLGNYPIGVRFQRERNIGPVSVVNEFEMISPLIVHLGLKFIDNFSIDFFQEKYYEAYQVVIEKFNLIESNSIHVALEKSGDEYIPVGIRGFLRQIVEGEFR